MIAGRPVFLVLLLHTISGPSTARTISAPLRRTSRCIQKLAASCPNRSPAQRVRFGSGGARKRADDIFIKKRQPRIHHRANQRSVCAVKARSSRMSARRVLKKLVASPQTEAQRSGFGLDKEERRNEGEMAFALKKKTPSRTICSTRRRGGGGWIRTTEAKRNRFTVCPLWPLGNSSRYEIVWSWWTDSNPRPADYKSAALPAELHQHLNRHCRQPLRICSAGFRPLDNNSKTDTICQQLFL